MGIKQAIIDMDIIAYKASSLCDKTFYKWIRKDSEGNIECESELYESAKSAKLFYEELELLEDTEGWERIKIIEEGKEEECIDLLKEMVKEYQKTAKMLTRNSKMTFKGYLTVKGTKKTKDIKGIEHKYQGNRTDLVPPRHLITCREYLLNNYDWIKLAPDTFEADAIIIYKAEQAGKEAMIMSCDKDLSQAEGTYFVDMNKDMRNRKLLYCDPVGELIEEKNAKGSKKIKGTGFKWSVFQAMVGDSSDGYYGFYNFGQVAAWDLLNELESKEEIIETVYKFYKDKLKNGLISPYAEKLMNSEKVSEEIQQLNKELVETCEPEEGKFHYISWDGQNCSLSALELFQQHLNRSYQERGPKDLIFDLSEYINE